MARTAVRGRLTWQLATVVGIVDETRHVRTIALDCPDWPGHLAGQHIDVRLTADDGYQAQRSYSIATPASGARIEITVARIDDGEVSPYLVDELRLGDRLELRGPIGGYFVWRPEDGGPLFLAGGGSGIVPLMAMLRVRHAAAASVPVRFLVSARSEDELIYRRELEKAASGHSGVELFVTLTRAQPAGWSGYRGRVDRAMLAKVVWPWMEAPRCYVCGPTGFVETVASGLVALGHEPGTIRTERFGPTGG